jgi:hypothetical protein
MVLHRPVELAGLIGMWEFGHEAHCRMVSLTSDWRFGKHPQP